MPLNQSSNAALVQGSSLACVPDSKIALPVPRGCKRSAASFAVDVGTSSLENDNYCSLAT